MPQMIDATQARNSFSDVLNRVLYGGEEVVVRRQGQPVVRITQLKDQSYQKAVNNGTAFLKRLSRYGLQDAPTDLAKNHDHYTWD